MQQNFFLFYRVFIFIHSSSNYSLRGIVALPDSKIHGVYMGPTWGRQDPDGPHAGPMILVISNEVP